jgi:hypothetical protein
LGVVGPASSFNRSRTPPTTCVVVVRRLSQILPPVCFTVFTPLRAARKPFAARCRSTAAAFFRRDRRRGFALTLERRLTVFFRVVFFRAEARLVRDFLEAARFADFLAVAI